jgi:hypothetical protein
LPTTGHDQPASAFTLLQNEGFTRVHGQQAQEHHLLTDGSGTIVGDRKGKPHVHAASTATF